VGKAKRAHRSVHSKQWWARRKCAFAHPTNLYRALAAALRFSIATTASIAPSMAPRR
jgi:hypothetical protein